MLLSVCLITYNEEKFIGDCLRSVEAIADEIIVIDACSTDATRSICEAAGCRVFQHPWENDYARARNHAIGAAQGRWILFLDADEELVESASLLKSLRRDVSDQVGGFLLERTDIYRHKDSGKLYRHPIGIVRVVRNIDAIRYRSPIHEEVHSSIYDAGFRLEVLTNCSIRHKVHASSDEFLAAKQTRYLAMLNSALSGDPDNAWWLYHKAKTLWFFNRVDEARSLFLAVADQPATRTDLRVSAYCNVAMLETEEAAALAWVEQAERLIPHTFNALLVKADAHYNAGKYRRALDVYMKIPTSLRANAPGSVIPGGVYLRPELKMYKLGCCLFAMNWLTVARLVFLFAYRRYPFDPINLYGLSLVYKQQGNLRRAESGLRECMRCEPGWKQPAREIELLGK